MLEAYLRPLYQQLVVDPFVKKIAKRFSHNTITLFACLTGIAVAPMLMLKQPALASIFLLISGYFDTLDGTVARLTGNLSARGAVLDMIADRIVELAIILGLFAVDPSHRGWLILLMLGSCYLCVTSLLIVGVFTTNALAKGFHFSPGLMERAEAFLFFLAMIWLPEHFTALSIVFTGLVLVTSYQRINNFMRTAK